MSIETTRAQPTPHATRRIGLSLAPQTRLFAAFFLYSFSLGGIFPRLGDLQRAMGIAEGALGLALIGTAVGTLISLTFAGRILDRVGYRPALLGLTPLLALVFALASFASGPLLLFIALVPAGLCIGAIEVIVNLEADRIEHQSGRRIMNRAHAFWSFGFFGAGLIGAGLSQAGLSPQAHLLLMVPLVLASTLLLLGRYEAAPHRSGAHAGAAARFARPTWPILVLVALTLSALVLEGAGAEWSAIYMRDVFGSAPFVAGSAVAIGALTQAVTRFFADRFVERFSPVGVARVLLLVLGAGALMVFAAPSGAVALLGFAVMGVGTSAIFPLAMSAAAQRTDRPAATNVAALAQISFVAFLLGPPLLGFVAEHWGIRWSFGLGLPLVALSWWAAGSLRSNPAPTPR
ncbi:MAG: MFS transporter [Methylibium sp. NZG]|nr:MAG: MFS transporter [Methylibium sp. NZG]